MGATGMSVKIRGREYTDEEFGELIGLGASVCGYLRARVARPVDLLVALALAAVACERALVKAGGFGVPVSEALRELTGSVAAQVDVMAVGPGTLPWRAPCGPGSVN